MWFLGLVIGAIIGAVGGAQGAILGGLFGAGLGWVISQKPSVPSDSRLRTIESSIKLLQQRVAGLEKTIQAQQSTGLAPVNVSSAAEFPEPSASERRDAPPAESYVPPRPPPLDTDNSLPPHEVSAPDSLEPGHVPPAAPPPVRAAQPSPIWNFFFGGNTLVRFGVIVLFFGVGFLLKYASEHIVIPIEARFIAVAMGAIVMLAIGWRLRGSRPGYGLIMQGGGIGLLYLTVFAAFRLYQLLPAGLVFVLLVATAFFSAMLAVLQDSRSLAAIGVTGGFVAPILASTGAGSHVMLFSFYAVLNLGILIIAWFKPWRSLNFLGFAFTFIIGLLWGGRYYRADLFASTEPFLILFFLF
jgi:uncharacterized membrane protein